MIIIGIAGKKGSGKDTFANLFASTIINTIDKEMELNLYKKRFADSLKNICSSLTMIPLKRMPESTLFTEEVFDFTAKDKEESTLFDITIGKLMQKIGEEVFRKNFDELTWIKRFILGIQSYSSNSIIIVPDVRYKTELTALKKFTGDTESTLLLYNVERKGFDRKDGRSDTHKSEVDLDSCLHDFYHIDNNKDLNSLAKLVIDEFKQQIEVFMDFNTEEIVNNATKFDSPF